MSEISPLERTIHQTLCWFFLSQYPATAFEVWKWLWKPEEKYRLSEVREALQESAWLRERVQAKDGFYCLIPPLFKGGLGGVNDMLVERRARFLHAARKFKKVRCAARWFGLFASVRAVAAVNTLAWWHTHAESDLDLYIVVSPGTIWATRAAIVFPFALMGHRPRMVNGDAKKRDPFCFSFFTIADALETEVLQIEGEDPYLAYWTRSVVPVFDRDDVFEVFEKVNGWVSFLLPNVHARVSHPELCAHGYVCLIPAICLRMVERLARRVQERRFPASIRTLMNRDTRVVVSDRMLKFHDHDDRAQYRDRFVELTNVC